MPHYTVNDEVVPGHFLVKFLGKGGFGEVWKATGPGGVEVAIKIINLTSDQGFKEFRALRMFRKLKHPNLIPLSGFWLKDEEGRLIDDSVSDNSTRIQRGASEMVIAMGLGEKSLLDRLKECKKAGIQGIPQVELIDYIDQAARAIDYLNDPIHDLGRGPVGIQHCDIKPGNILIVGNAIQVCDFGLARVLSDQARSSTVASFTPAYTAPEVIEGAPCRQTDQYSLAITYVELRTGALPFTADNPSKAMKIHLSGQLDFSKLPKNEAKVMRRATALNPAERFPTTQAMVQALKEAMGEGTPRMKSSVDISLEGVQPGQEVVPGYRLVRLIGRGGYGEVWEAIAPGGKHCALKIIRNLDVSANTQELRTLELMKSLEHVHLMEVQAFWLLNSQGELLSDDDSSITTANMLVILTQLAVKNLAQRLKECHKSGQRGIPPQELLLYMRQSADAIDYLNSPVHVLGDKPVSIQHRDIKPENILLTRNNLVKISDFGLAKMVEGTSATIHSQSRGLTIAYAAPEMFKGMVTRWTDQYSLAITYYKLRTGTLPFDSNQPPFTMMLVHTEGRLDFSLVTTAEQDVLLRATRVIPEERHETCTALVLALEAALNGSGPPPARPATPSHGLLHLSTPSPGSVERTRQVAPIPAIPTAAPPGGGSNPTPASAPPKAPVPAKTKSSRPGSTPAVEMPPGPPSAAPAAAPPSASPPEALPSIAPPAQPTGQRPSGPPLSVPPAASPPPSARPPTPLPLSGHPPTASPLSGHPQTAAPPSGTVKQPTAPPPAPPPGAMTQHYPRAQAELPFLPDELSSGSTPPPERTDRDASGRTLRPDAVDKVKKQPDGAAQPALAVASVAVEAAPPRHAWQNPPPGLSADTTDKLPMLSGDWQQIDGPAAGLAKPAVAEAERHAPTKRKKPPMPAPILPWYLSKRFLGGVFVGVAAIVTTIIILLSGPPQTLRDQVADRIAAGEFVQALDLLDESGDSVEEKKSIVKEIIEEQVLRWCETNIENEPEDALALLDRMEKYVPPETRGIDLRRQVPAAIAQKVRDRKTDKDWTGALSLIEKHKLILGDDMAASLTDETLIARSDDIEANIEKLFTDKRFDDAWATVNASKDLLIADTYTRLQTKVTTKWSEDIDSRVREYLAEKAEEKKEEAYNRADVLIADREVILGEEKAAALKKSVLVARSNHIEQGVEALLKTTNADRFSVALDRVDKVKGLLGEKAVTMINNEIFGAWIKVAENQNNDKNYVAALATVKTILKKNSGFERALAVQKEADTALSRIDKEVNALANSDKYAEAVAYLKKELNPPGERIDRVLASALKRASELRGADLKGDISDALVGDLAEANKVLEAVKNDVTGTSSIATQWEALRKSVAEQRQANGSKIAEAMGRAGSESFKQIAGVLTNKGLKQGNLPDSPTVEKLQSSLEEEWLKWAKQSADDKEKEMRLDELIAVLPSSKGAIEALAALRGGKTDLLIKSGVAALAKGQTAEARKILENVATKDEPLKKRVDKLVALIDRLTQVEGEARDPKTPKSPPLDALENELGDPVIAADKMELQARVNELRRDRLRNAIPRIPQGKDPNWKGWLEECDKVTVTARDAWVKACRVECLVETGKFTRTDQAEARKDLGVVDTPEARLYVEYALALAEWRPGQNNAKAADAAVTLLGRGGLKAPLDASHRQEMLCRILYSPVDDRRTNEPGVQPFHSPEDTEKVFGWMSQAADLLATEPIDPKLALDIRVTLTLAAWHRVKPATELATRSCDALIGSTRLKDISELDQLRIRLIHAATRPADRNGREQAIDSYLAALQLAKPMLEKSDKRLFEQLMESVVTPCRNDNGAKVLGTDPDDPLKRKAATLFARVGKILASDAKSWSRLKEKDAPIDPLKIAATLFASAHDLTGHPEHLVRAAWSRLGQGDVDHKQYLADATAALKANDKFSGGHTLKGYALYLEARELSDLERKRERLTLANQEFEEAEPLAKQELQNKDYDQDEGDLSNLYLSWSETCILLGNYAPDAEQPKWIQRAVKYAKEATDRDPRNPFAWEAQACALEDVGWKEHKLDIYAEAIKAFGKAMERNYIKEQTSPWVGRARALFKWGEETKDEQYLRNAEVDILHVIGNSPDKIEAAEALFWRAQIAVFRSKRNAERDARLALLKDADEDFSKGLSIAQERKSAMWIEAILSERAGAYHSECSYCVDKKRPIVAELARRADEAAKAVSEVSAAQGLYYRGHLALLQGRRKDAADRFRTDLTDTRTQDRPFLLGALTTRARLLLDEPNGGLEPDFEAALADARTADAVAAKMPPNKVERARVKVLRAQAAESQASRVNPTKKKERSDLWNEAIAAYQDASEADPKNPARWSWAYSATGCYVGLKSQEGSLPQADLDKGLSTVNFAIENLPESVENRVKVLADLRRLRDYLMRK